MFGRLRLSLWGGYYNAALCLNSLGQPLFGGAFDMRGAIGNCKRHDKQRLQKGWAWGGIPELIFLFSSGCQGLGLYGKHPG